MEEVGHARAPSSPGSPVSNDRGFARIVVATGLYQLGYSLFFLLPVRLVALGAHPRQIGLYMALLGVLPVALMPLIGHAADRQGAKRFVLAGYAISSLVATGFLGLAQLGVRLALLQLGWGVGFTGAILAGSILVVELAPSDRLAHRIGIFGAASLAMQAVGPGLAEWIQAREGWNALYALSALFTATPIAVVAGLVEPPRSHTEGPAPRMISLIVAPRLHWLVVATLMTGATFGSALSFTAAAAHESGLARVSDFFIAYASSALLVRVAAGKLSDRIGRHEVAVPALALYAIAVAGLSFVHSSFALGVAGTLFGLAHGLYYPALNALVIEQAPRPARGRAMALYNAIFLVGYTAGTLGYGALAKSVGYAWMFRCAGFVGAVAVALVLADACRSRGM